MGIGTDEPGAKLEVAGDIKLSDRGKNIISYRMALGEGERHASTILGNNVAPVDGGNTENIEVIQSDSIDSHWFMVDYARGFTFHSNPPADVGAEYSERGGELMRITTEGKVGIGINTPDAKLAVNDSTQNLQARVGSLTNGISPIVRLQGRHADTNQYADISLDAENGLLVLSDPGSSSASIGQSPTVIDSDGNVGIGTSSPDAKLDVEGSLQADTFTGEASIYTHAQDITTSGAVDVEYYLAERSNGIDYPSAAFVNETNGTVDIHYLDYSGAGLTIGEFQPETTLTGFTSPNDAESFEYNDITYLVVGDDSTEVKAYAWDAANHEFTLLSGDEIEVAGHVDTEVFIQENRQIVAIAQSSGITLYEWGGSNFNPIQTIGLADARKLYFFEADLNADDATEGYLAAAAGDGLVIYQWQNGKNFEPMTLAHTLDATHSQNAHYFEIDSRQFLMVSRNQDTAGSPLYEWTGTEFELAQTIDTYSGSLGATYFQINGTHYLVVIARGSGVHNDYLLFYWYEDGAFQYRENIVYANTSGDLADIEYSFLDGADERSRIIMAEGTTSRALLLDQYNNTSVEDNLFVGGQDIIMAANNTQKNIDGISYEDNNDAFPGNRGVFSFHADQEHRPGWDSPGAAISASGGYFAGDVGIGTTEPEAKLHINGDDNDGTNAALKISSGSQVMLIDGNEIDSYDNEVPINIHINGNAGADTIFNKNGGNVGIGTSSSIGTTCADDARLCVNGNIYAQTTKLNSDSRLKTSVTTIPSALEKILSLRGVTFEWKQEEFPDRNFADGTQIGLIAQEVEEVFPELVSQGEYKSVSYANLVSPLIEAVKELHALYQGHADRLAALEAQNAEQDNHIAHQDERIAHQDELIVQLEVRLAALEAAQ